jgi:HEAT repeat protein
VKPIIGLGFVAAVAIAAAPQDKGPKKRAEGLGERVNEILSVSVDDDATRRRVAVEKLLDVGPEAVPYVGEALGRGNKNIVRTCIVALGEIGNESCQAELVKYFATRKPGDAVEVAVIAAYALGGCPGHAATETLLRLVDDPAEAEHVRAAAAVALARAPIADKERLTAAFAQASKRGDADPEVLGGLALAVGRSAGPVAIAKIPALLKELKDPAARAGCWLALAVQRRFAPAALAAPDIASKDPVLMRCAVLGCGETPRADSSSSTEIREARIVALGLGAGDRGAFQFAAGESEVALRPYWYGAAAARGWATPLLQPPWSEREPGELGRFAAAALLAWRGGLKADEIAELTRQARAAWQQKADSSSALLLGSLEDHGSEASLGPEHHAGGDWHPAARLAWKWLRGDLDRHRFETALLANALDNRVLPEGWLSDAMTRFACAILGGGSQFFQDQSRVPFPPKVLLPASLTRRKRTLPGDHPMYADLWYQLQSSRFDVLLAFPRHEGG